MAMTDDQRRQIIEGLRNQTDEEADAIWDEMVRDGIIDRDGNVLKKIPEPPDWLLEASRNGQARKAEPSAEPAKKARRARKRS
jgi:hypothetical protein